jgi:hypothetical protein
MSRSRMGWGSRSSVALLLLTASTLGAWPLGCGKTTKLGDARVGDDGTGANGSADGGNTLGNAGLGGDSGEASAGNSGGGGDAGEVGAGGAGAGGAAEDAGPRTCAVPRPPSDPNATEEQRERAALIRDACQQLAEPDCLDTLRTVGPISAAAARACSAADRALACEQDALLYFAKHIEPTCEQEWRAMVACEIEANRTPGSCTSTGAIGPLLTQPNPCQVAVDAYSGCTYGKRGTGLEVTGSRGTCFYLDQRDYGKCLITCEVDRNRFGSSCEVAPGFPAECTCSVNGRDLGDDVDLSFWAFYASDCRDAAQRVANGECIERLDCCFTYLSPGGAEYCACTADPAQGGWSSCEAAAQAGGGKVVDICPQYVSRLCRPPNTSGCR